MRSRFQVRFSILSNVIASLLASAALVITGHAGDWAEREATLKVPSELEILRNGIRLGSSTIPAGRQVQILEESGDRFKVSAGGLAEGWVAKDAVELLRPISVTSALPAKEAATLRDASSKIASQSSVQPATGDVPTEQQADEKSPLSSPSAANPNPIGEKGGLSGNSPQSVAKTSSVQITALADESEQLDFGDGPCRGQEVKKVFDCQTRLGRDAEGKNVELIFYAILVNENERRPYSYTVNGKIVPPVEVKRLRGSSGQPNAQRFTHSQRELSCRCCRRRLDANLQGYYAELLADGVVVATAISPLKKAYRDALEAHLGKALPN